MKFMVVGIGAGDPELITLKAIRIIKEADVVLIPYSPRSKVSVAGQIVLSNIPDIVTTPIIFPMYTDSKKREKFLLSEFKKISALWYDVEKVVLPVIGDSILYATGFYLFNVLKKHVPEIELSLVPGISAHQLASSRLGAFLAMGEDIFSVIPCSNNREEILAALKSSNVVALYKPNMLKNTLLDTVMEAGPWQRIIRIDRASLDDEKIYEGKAALEPTEEYLSILLLWRKHKNHYSPSLHTSNSAHQKW